MCVRLVCQGDCVCIHRGLYVFVSASEYLSVCYMCTCVRVPTYMCMNVSVYKHVWVCTPLCQFKCVCVLSSPFRKHPSKRKGVLSVISS